MIRIYIQAAQKSICMKKHFFVVKNKCWDSSITMDSATNRGIFFIGIRVRIFAAARIEPMAPLCNRNSRVSHWSGDI